MNALMVIQLIHFMRPGRLWWLLVPAAVVIGYLALSVRTTPRGPVTRLNLRAVLPKDKAWKRHLAVLCSVASLASLVVAFAQPQDYREVPRDRATIVLTIDVSRSMIATDVEPSRLAAAQSAAKSFLGDLPDRFTVALVQFAASPQLVVPPTTDRAAVSTAIDNLEVKPSTAIGEGIYSSLDALKLAPDDPKQPGKKPPAAIVLLSDGATNVGRPSLGAAQQSGKQGVPIYSIAYGTPGGYVMEDGQRQPVPVNHHELAAVAKASGGEKFSAESLGQLRDVYKSIARSVGYEKVYAEVTDRFVGYALLLAVLAGLGVISLAARWP